MDDWMNGQIPEDDLDAGTDETAAGEDFLTNVRNLKEEPDVMESAGFREARDLTSEAETAGESLGKAAEEANASAMERTLDLSDYREEGKTDSRETAFSWEGHEDTAAGSYHEDRSAGGLAPAVSGYEKPAAGAGYEDRSADSAAPAVSSYADPGSDSSNASLGGEQAYGASAGYDRETQAYGAAADSARESRFYGNGAAAGNESGGYGTGTGSGSGSPAPGSRADRPYTSPYDVYRFNGGTRPVYQANPQEGYPYGGQNPGDQHSRVDPEGPGAPGGPGGPSDPSHNAPKKSGKGKKIAAVLGLAALFGIVAALVFFAVTYVAGTFAGSKTNASGSAPVKEAPKVVIGNDRGGEPQPPAGKSDLDEDDSETEKKLPSDIQEGADSPDLTIPEVVEMTMPSMVAITNTTLTEYRSLFGESGQYENVSAGSGIIVGETEENLLIATNDHVITDANKITVTFIDESVVEGTVSASDNRNDLAIVAVEKEKIEKETLEAIRIITIGNSDNLRVGESVVAIGNALGYGQSVSAGVVSALNRQVEVDGVTHELIQTDASINPGNSGGALINLRGELIGINEIKAVNTKVEGVGYAIPMATAKPILENLGTKAARTKVDEENASYIGIHCMTMPDYYVDNGYPAGAYVSDVMEGGPAEKAGLQAADIITAIDGSTVTTSSQLITYLEYYAAGETVSFTVNRLNKEQTDFDVLEIEITLGNRNDAVFNEQEEEKAG